MEARAVATTEAIALVGFRLGATLATAAAATLGGVSRLVLWSPFPSGRAYLRELRAFASLSQQDGAPGTPSGGDIEAAGFVITQATTDALSKLDVTAIDRAPAPRVLLVDRDDRPVETRLSEHLGALGCDVSRVRLDGTAAALEQPAIATVPERIFEEILCWFDPWWPAGRDLVRTSVGTRSAVPPVVRGGTGYHEHGVRFGDDQRLFGVFTEPSDGRAPETAIIFLNTGCEYQVGPHRLYVPLARHWASRGHLVLRFDLGGIGDSRPPDETAENLSYPDHALDDVRAAVALVRERPRIQRIVLVGLCSGAWHAFLAAREGVQVNAVFAVNAPLFLHEGLEWSRSRHLIDQYERQRYRRSLRDPGRWAKALRGRADYGYFFRLTISALVRRVREGVSALVGNRRLSGLAGELERVAGRGIQTLFLFAHGEDGLEYFRLHAGPALRRRAIRTWIQKVDIEGADHTFRPLDAQRILRSLLLNFVERVGASPAVPARDHPLPRDAA